VAQSHACANNMRGVCRSPVTNSSLTISGKRRGSSSSTPSPTTWCGTPKVRPAVMRTGSCRGPPWCCMCVCMWWAWPQVYDAALRVLREPDPRRHRAAAAVGAASGGRPDRGGRRAAERGQAPPPPQRLELRLAVQVRGSCA